MPTTPNGTAYTETAFTAGGANAWRTVADSHASDSNLPVVLFCHGNPGSVLTSADKQFASGYTTLRNWIIDNGWGFIEGHGGGANWGNQEGRDCYESMFAATALVWDIEKVVVIGRSMGALVGAWLASQSSVISPRCAGFVSLSGTANLSDRYSTASGSDITNMNAAYGVTNEAQWRAAVVDFDPLLADLSIWDGRNGQMQWDTSDTTVPYAINGQAWDSKYGPRLNLRRVITTSGGDHNTTPNDPTHSSATIAFLQDAQLRQGTTIREVWAETLNGPLRIRSVKKSTGAGVGGGGETQTQLPALGVGAHPSGEVTYPQEGTVIYMSTTGNDGNPGTFESPKATIGAAITACPTDGTVHVLPGVYEQSIGSTSKRITIQADPGTVWFDGSQTVTGFTGSGPWVKTGWTYEFDHSTSYTEGDTNLRWIDSSYPMAHWSDQVYIDDVRQTRVSGTPGAGQFAIDYATDTLTLGTNPSGKTVRATVRGHFAILSAPNVVIRGLGIRRFATGLGGALATLTLTSAASGALVENLVMEDCGQQSISMRAAGQTVRHTSIIRPGLTGIHATKATGLIIERSYFDVANYQNFKHQPAASAIKLSPDVIAAEIRDNLITNSRSYGIWFDTDCFDNIITGNYINGSLEAGILSEACDMNIIAGNYLENCKFGVSSCLSTREEIWCNQADNNAHWDIGLTQDARRNTKPSTMGRAPWLAEDVRMCNNVLTMKTSPSGKLFQLYALDKESNVPAPQMVSEMAGNLLVAHNGDGTTTRMFGWDTNGDNQVGTSEIYKTVPSFEALTGWINVVTNTPDPNFSTVSSFSSRARTLPSAVATALDLTPGVKYLGPPRAKPYLLS